MLEKGPGFQASLREIPNYLNTHTVSNGLVAGVFNVGPLILLADLARQGGVGEVQVGSWLAAVFLMGGFLTFTLGLYYKKPINCAWTIAGAVVVGGALKYYPLTQVMGAVVAAGVLVALLGALGLVTPVVRLLPLPVVMGMIGGTLLRFGLQLPISLLEAPLLTGIPLLGYLLLTRFFPRLPGVLGALVLGLVTAALLGELGGTSLVLALSQPSLVNPQFSLPAILAVGLPLALMIVGAENMQAIGVLLSEGYGEEEGGVPVNAMMFLSGCATIMAGFLGGHAANIAGVKTAICAMGNHVPREGRYVASLVEGVIFISIGIFAPTVLNLVTALPSALLQFIIGLALVPVLGNALRLAWNGEFPLGATFAFLTAASGITLLGIGPPLWALVAGVGVAFSVGEGKKA